VDPAQVAKIVIVSEGREVPVDIDPSLTVEQLARMVLADRDVAQRLASRVLGTSASHVAGAINVTVTRQYREAERALVIEAVKIPGHKGSVAAVLARLDAAPEHLNPAVGLYLRLVQASARQEAVEWIRLMTDRAAILLGEAEAAVTHAVLRHLDEAAPSFGDYVPAGF
jgi:hypothetical protein